MRYTNVAPWALALASAVTLAVLSAGVVATAEDYAPGSTVRFLSEGVPVADRTPAKIVACSEERPAARESILRSASTGGEPTTLSFRIPQAKPVSKLRSPLRQNRSPGPSPLRRPSFASHVEYHGTQFERSLGRMRSYRVAPSKTTTPLATVVAAKPTIRVVSHDAQTLRNEQTSSHDSPLHPVMSVVRVLGESTPSAEDKRFRVKRLPKPGEQEPRLQLIIGD